MRRSLKLPRVILLAGLLALGMLLGCSKKNTPAPGVTVGLVVIGTTVTGEIKARASFTNGFSRPVQVSLRSMVLQTNGAWVTNFTMPPFMGVIGPNSLSSEVQLSANGTFSAALAPQQVDCPFRLEFLCFPARSGLAGIWDNLVDKAAGWKDGGQHYTYLGESFVIASPMIERLVKSGGAEARPRPVPGQTTQPAR